MASLPTPEPTPTSTLATKYGTISYTMSEPTSPTSHTRPTLLLIHGNSSSSKIFRPVFENSFLKTHYRLLAFDLPGHGLSSNAPDPAAAYTQPAYAALAIELLNHLSISSVIVFGWSLGGHVAIEMMPLLSPPTSPFPVSTSTTPAAASQMKLVGIIITGTPPASNLAQVVAGFSAFPPDPMQSPPAREVLTAAEMDWWAASTPPSEPWMRDAVERTDGRARRIMFETFLSGDCADQVGLVESNKDILVGVVNGGAEPLVSLDYVDKIKWANLWGGKCVRLGELGHAPFWERPDMFMPYLEDFVKACTGVQDGNE